MLDGSRQLLHLISISILYLINGYEEAFMRPRNFTKFIAKPE